MKFADIITLAKAGYKPGEIKELIELAEPAPDPEPTQEEPEPPQEEPAPDYKALYEETQKKLKAAQAANRKQPVPKPEEKSMDDLFREIF